MSNENEAVVEEKPDEKPPDLTLRALEQRIRQQEILAELGVVALQGAVFDALLFLHHRFAIFRHNHTRKRLPFEPYGTCTLYYMRCQQYRKSKKNS